MRRRTFVAHLASGAAALGAPALLRARGADADLVLRGGTVIDGTGAARRIADVAITGDRVSAIGRALAVRGRRELDCRDRVVAPGFVDLHTHVDGTLFEDPLLESTIRQGVTTVVIGADGGSRAPGERGDVAALLATIGALPPAANVGTLVGLGTVRGLVVGDAFRPATDDELARMVALVDAALTQGALGVSSGLEYPPGAFATRDELIACCRPLAARGLAYHTHLRNEDDRLFEALDEAIAVATGARCALQVSHLKQQGPRNWDKLDGCLTRLAAARAAGSDAQFDVYPYLAYQTGLSNLFPVWARDGGTAAFLARLDAPDSAERIRTETLGKVALIGGWHNVQIASVSAGEDKAAEGERLDDYAHEREEEPYATAVGLLKRNGGTVGMVGFAMREENLERLLADPHGMVASDGGAWATSGPARRGVPHPRGSGAFARVLGRYVRERRVLTLEQAVAKMSARPAARIGLADRGTLRVGAFADVVVFDPDRVADRATFSDPFQYADGVMATIVNGALAFVDGERGPRTGRAVRAAG